MKYLVLILFLLCSALQMAGSQKADGDTETFYAAALQELPQALASANRVEVYEGLPNPFGEAKFFESEKRTKDCRQISGQWFYAKPQDARMELQPELQRMTEAGLFQHWRGPKFCGGFHADYAVVLTTGQKELHVLLCFGCHEAKIARESEPFTADIKTVDFQLTCDLNGKYFEALRSLFAPYSRELPRRAAAPSSR